MTASAHAVIDLAYGDDALADTPSYTSISDPAGINVVQSFSVSRGRQYLTDVTAAGTASINFVDTAGKLDPTNAAGTFFPMDPNCPARIQLWNPKANNYTTIFRGLVQDCPQTIYFQGGQVNQGTINLVDLFSLLALKEVPPGLDFGAYDLGSNTVASAGNTLGDTTYAQQQVNDRIAALAADAGIPAALTHIFTGNVWCQFTTYSPGYSILAAMQDAADSEWPGVANLFVDAVGRLTFRGRLARFNSGPGNPYGISTWQAGDATAVASDTDKASIASMTIDRDVTKIVNNALFTPVGIADADIAGQLSVDSGSITQFGSRSITGQDLLTEGGISGSNTDDPLAETFQFSTFFTDNLAAAQTRIAQVTFRPVPVTAANATKHWQLICQVEIGDVIEITTTHPGGGGFAAVDYFVEGITYDVDMQGGGSFPNVTLTLDLSPTTYFTDEPWPH